MQDSSAPRSSTRGPMTKGAVTDNYYTPTTEEKRVIDSANKSFVASYLTGIAFGVTGGLMLVKHRGISWKSLPGMALLGATGLSGELLGRKLGEARARQLLATSLPADSKLREMLQEKAHIPRSQTAARGESIEGHHDYGMEGAVLNPTMSPVNGRGGGANGGGEGYYGVPGNDNAPDEQESAATSSSPSSSSTSSWESIRSNNPASNTVWGRIRSGRAPQAPSQPAYDVDDSNYDPDTTPPTSSPSLSSSSASQSSTQPPSVLIPRTRAEQLETERAGQISRNRYGDLDTPAVHAVGGRGLMGPYGDTVAATPAGNAPIPRTREEMEESFATGRVRRNQYGDLIN
ncbi:hypothetical protein PhCBS80983_g04069 [Powellomyces hirtus]|uniref:Uncharacterized protein n=1 Tax=Powellomyces hirtus TaxID=109895 RepID=A0A507E1B5_9FUNG|nr:hypothetical protein PhCBS80983_g04069 [Powellomyces hirtus]